ncbi:MAG: PLP-dependent aminotransferase family protein, partial [Paracoccaceae bacterium]
GLMQSAVMAVGQPDEALFPRDEWARILRRQARRLHGSAFGYEDYCGLLRLRQLLAQRLTDHRGMFLSAEQVLITPGSQASLVLLAQALAAPGDTALIEDPGYVGARLAFAGAGLRLCPMPVDGEGADPGAVDPGAASGAKLIYLTPANHFPLGHRMSLARRNAAIAYAQEVGAVIIEDDYDSEFLWRGRAIAAMQAMAPERVITIGSLSKSLMPGLRLGWMVVPMGLVEPLADAQRNLGYAANLHAQGAFADLIESGRYHSHLARIAHRYAERGAALAEALAAIPGVAVTPPDGGVQLAAHLAPEVEARALAALRAAGFGAGPLSRYCLKADCSGLVVGFADATPERIAGFARTLQETLAQG